MANKLMYIPNDDTQSYPFIILGIKEVFRDGDQAKICTLHSDGNENAL